MAAAAAAAAVEVDSPVAAAGGTAWSNILSFISAFEVVGSGGDVIIAAASAASASVRWMLPVSVSVSVSVAVELGSSVVVIFHIIIAASVFAS